MAFSETVAPSVIEPPAIVTGTGIRVGVVGKKMLWVSITSWPPPTLVKPLERELKPGRITRIGEVERAARLGGDRRARGQFQTGEQDRRHGSSAGHS